MTWTCSSWYKSPRISRWLVCCAYQFLLIFCISRDKFLWTQLYVNSKQKTRQTKKLSTFCFTHMTWTCSWYNSPRISRWLMHCNTVKQTSQFFACLFNTWCVWWCFLNSLVQIFTCGIPTTVMNTIYTSQKIYSIPNVPISGLIYTFVSIYLPLQVCFLGCGCPLPASWIIYTSVAAWSCLRLRWTSCARAYL